MSFARVAAATLGAACAAGAFVLLEGEPRPPEPPPVAKAPAAPSAPAQEEPARKSQRQRVDGRTGLILDEGWELVATQCTACHSAKLVTQNAGDREHWETMLRWMQRTQNLWAFAPEVETTILDYLAKNYGPREYSRRPPLDPWLLPPDPDTKRGPPVRAPLR